MSEQTDRAPSAQETARSEPRLRRSALKYALPLAVVFLLAFVPMWMKATSRGAERDAAQHELQLARIELALLSSAVEARRGEYESARLLAVRFFTDLRGAVDQGDDAVISPEQRDRLQPVLLHRDDLITLLARSDPASADRLVNLSVAFRNAMGE